MHKAFPLYNVIMGDIIWASQTIGVSRKFSLAIEVFGYRFGLDIAVTARGKISQHFEC